MPNIVNITRTYRFADGIPLQNSQLDYEIANIVDTINKDISAISSNVIVTASIPIGYIGANGVSFAATNTWKNVFQMDIGEGEWDISGMIGMLMQDNLVTSWSGLITDTSGTPSVDGAWFKGQDNLTPRAYSATTGFDYISIPPYTYNVSGDPVTGNITTLAGATIYAKVMATYTGLPPKAFGSIRARRMSK